MVRCEKMLRACVEGDDEREKSATIRPYREYARRLEHIGSLIHIFCSRSLAASKLAKARKD